MREISMPELSQMAHLEQKKSHSPEQILFVTDGEGEGECVVNPGWQDVVTHKAFSLLNRTLEQLILPEAETKAVVVSNLGSSSSPNAIKNMNHIIKCLRRRYQLSGKPVPHFQASFNDLPSSDFNSLFKLLTSESRQFYAAGVPGSCYGRLFPRASVNVFLSTNCLHWLSQVPKEVMDKDSPAYNGNRIWLDGSNAAVIDAYKKQAMRDLKIFLDARGQELVSEGMVYCTFNSSSEKTGFWRTDWLRPLSGDNKSSTLSICRMMELVWQELISEGVFTEEHRQAFNLPLYQLTQEEVKEVLQNFTDVFCVQNLEQMQVSEGDFLQDIRQQLWSPETVIRDNKAVFGPLLLALLGEKLVSVYYGRFYRLLLDRERKGEGGIKTTYASHVLMLLRT